MKTTYDSELRPSTTFTETERRTMRRGAAALHAHATVAGRRILVDAVETLRKQAPLLQGGESLPLTARELADIRKLVDTLGAYAATHQNGVMREAVADIRSALFVDADKAAKETND